MDESVSELQESGVLQDREGLPKSLKKAAERGLERQAFEKKCAEAFGAVKSGEDKEGALLRNLFVEAVESSDKSLGPTADLLSRAWESEKNLQDDAEVKKLHSSLRAIYKTSSLGEYRVEIHEAEERDSAVRERMTQDLRDLPERLADKFLDSYIDKKAAVLIEEEKTLAVLGQENPSSREIRQSAYRLQRQELRLLAQEDRILTRLNRREGLSELLEARFERRTFEPVEFEEFQKRGEEDRRASILQRMESFASQLAQEEGEHAVRTYEHIHNDVKVKLIGDLVNSELKIENLRENLRGCVFTGEADTICEMARSLKQAQLEKRVIQTEIKIALARQKTHDYLKNFQETRNELGKKFERLKLEKIAPTFAKLAIASKDYVGSLGDLTKRNVESEITPLLAEIEKAKASLSEFVPKAKELIGSLWEKTGDRLTNWVLESTKNVVDRTEAEAAKLFNSIEVRRINSRRWFYEKRHNLEVEMLKAKTLLGVESLNIKRHAGLLAEEIVTSGRLSVEELHSLRQKHTRIDELTKEFEQRKLDRFEREKLKNPYFKYFWNELEKHIQVISDKQYGEEIIDGEDRQITDKGDRGEKLSGESVVG